MKTVLSKNYKREPTNARLTKMEALKESKYLDEGDTFTGYYYDRPQVGDSFVFFCETLTKGESKRFSAGPFQTSMIVEVIDEFKFRTQNSIYYLIDKSRERDIKIQDLLK